MPPESVQFYCAARSVGSRRDRIESELIYKRREGHTFMYPNPIIKTFFDLDFQPDIDIGPSALTFLVDYFMRQNSGLDAALTILQVYVYRLPILVWLIITPSS